MAIETTSNPGINLAYQTYFSKMLLETATQAVKLNDYATRASLPRNVGAQSVRFFRRNTADSSKVLALAEGVAPTQYREIAFTPVDVPLQQYGEVAKITDVLSWTQLFDMLKQSMLLMGEDCALQADDITRNEIVTHVVSAGQARYSQGVANYAALQGASVTAGRFTAVDALDAMTQLTVKRAPTKNGYYVGIIPPQIARDLMDDDRWVKASQYSAVTQLFKGEVGMLYGIRFVVATNPFRENGATFTAQNAYDPTGNIFTSVFTGTDGYGVVDLAGQSPFSPRTIIVDKADKSDPLNQTITAGWKAYWAAKLLNENYVVTVRSRSAFA